MSVIEEQVNIAGQLPLPAFTARPSDGDPHPSVLVIFEIFGLNDHMRSVARRLAEAGFVGILPDFFRHDPVPYNSFSGARAVASGLSDEQAMADIASTLDFLASQPYALAGKTAVVGFCMGGRLAFLAATQYPGRLQAVVDFYGARVPGGSVHPGQTMTPLDHAAAIRCPLLLFFGDRDQSIPPEDIEAIRSRLQSFGKSFESVVYPGAGHGFFCEERDSYHAAAAEDAWARTLKFLREQLGEETVV